MRDPERWKDRVELSLDGRQIFFLFFGTAVTACLIFVGGVFVGKRIEQRSAPPISAEDPLAALDQLETEEPDDGLTFHEALMREDKRRARDPNGAANKPRPAPRPEAAVPPPEPRPAPHAEEPRRLPPPPPTAPNGAPHAAALHPPAGHPLVAKPAVHPVSPAAAPSGRFTLQLSSFADQSDADGFAQKIRAAGYRPVVIRSEVPGKGVFYRVRIGDYGSRAAAEQARADYEGKQHTMALVAPQ